jgi:hypothetical protein
LAGNTNAFLVELTSNGTTATYATYLGGSGIDSALAVAVDSADTAYITGSTTSANFPKVGATQAAIGGGTDAFVSVLSPGSNSLTFSTYLGGSGTEDQLTGSIAVDASKNIYVTGDTDSGHGSTTHFPTVNPFDGSWSAGGPCVDSNDNTLPCPDAFVTAYTAP